MSCRTIIAIAAILVIAPAAACTAENEPAASDSAALRPLRRAEILGTIAYGQTTGPVGYTDVPLYRAFAFAGAAGDIANIEVKGHGGKAVVYLLRSDFRTVASSLSGSGLLRKELSTDGTYYVAFREKDQEDASFTVSLRNDAANLPKPESPVVVRGDDRAFSLGRNLSDAVLETWKRDFWDGALSFTVVKTGDWHDGAVVVDGNGTSYVVTDVPTRYQGLPLPVTLRGSSDASFLSTVSIVDVTYGIANLTSPTVRGKLDAAPIVIGAEMPGVPLEVRASGKFFQNFVNGNACGRVRINGHDLTPASGETRLALVTPITVVPAPTCISPRATDEEDPSGDFALLLGTRLAPPVPPAGCGNGIVDPGEQCDDGNHEGRDGCSATCAYETLVDYSRTHDDRSRAIDLGSRWRRAKGRVDGSFVYQSGASQWWSFTLPRASTVKLDVSGRLQGSELCQSDFFGRSELWDDTQRWRNGEVLGNGGPDHTLVLPAGRYYFSVTPAYAPCAVGGSELVGGLYELSIDVSAP